MTKNISNPRVDFYFDKAKKWKAELLELRTIMLDCHLIEELKWGCPCYTIPIRSSQKSNIVLIHAFKEYCALLFFKGALLKDSRNILVQQTKNVQAARQIRFTSLQEIIKMERILKSYVYEAVKVEESGLKVNFKKTEEFKAPPEFQNKLKGNAELKTAFYELTPGRQRAYLLYFSSAKQSKTRESRIEKYEQKILSGEGLDD
jgi:uncharacterized protein YdeI (YjbR/CyaY-like superfamily)